jgi:hypothetical protein
MPVLRSLIFFSRGKFFLRNQQFILALKTFYSLYNSLLSTTCRNFTDNASLVSKP